MFIDKLMILYFDTQLILAITFLLRSPKNNLSFFASMRSSLDTSKEAYIWRGVDGESIPPFSFESHSPRFRRFWLSLLIGFDFSFPTLSYSSR